MRYLSALIFLLMAAALMPAAVHAADCSPSLPPMPLTTAVALARMEDCNRDLLAARRGVVAGLADARVAQQRPNPTLTLGAGSISPSAGIGAGAPWQKTLDSSLRYEQLIERGGKLALRRQAADHLVAAARHDVDEMRRQQRVAVLLAMVDLASAEARAHLFADIAALYQQTQQANARRTALGDLAPIDAQRQGIEATRAEADVQQAAADVQHARLALAALLALEAEAARLSVDPAVLVAPAQPEAGALESRPDVAAARARVDAAHAALDLARALGKTDVTVGLQVDHWPTSAANPVGTGNTVSLTLSMPLAIRHGYEGEMARALSDSEAADEALARVQAHAQADLDRLRNDRVAVEARQRLLQTQLAPQAEQVARAAELGYAKGALSLLDLLDARRVQRQTQLDLLAARADLARSVWATVVP